MQKPFNTYFKWLWGILALLLLLGLVFTRVEPSSAHHSYPTATHTRTPTLTPTPILETCHAIAFFEPEQASYQVGQEIKVTVRVTYKGEPLIGANVDAVVTRQPLDNVQAAAVPPLVDQSGDYEAMFVPELAGEYTFEFAINDPSGDRFLPCSAEATLRVEPAECRVVARLDPDESPHQLNDPITLSVDVFVNDVIQHTATVTAAVNRPDSPPEDLLNFSGSGPYTGVYTRTNVSGDYTFEVSVNDPERFSCQADPITVPVESSPTTPTCGIMLEFDQAQYLVNQPINVTVTVTNTNDIIADVTAVITRPDLSIDSTELDHINSELYRGNYPDTDLTGAYIFRVTANDPAGGQNFLPCTAEATTTVTTTPAGAATLRVTPQTLTTTLCTMTVTNAVAVENVSNLSFVHLELSYDPRGIQVIDADPNRRGVQVSPTSIFPAASISRNEVDTVRGRIIFEATLPSPFTSTGLQDLITLDWRPQRVGSHTINFEDETLLTNAAGQNISESPQDGTVQVEFVANCNTGALTLQGRTDHSGIVVAGAAGEQVQTDIDGYFAIIAEDNLTFTFPGYLPAQADLQTGLQAALPEGEAYKLGELNLLAGDINGDNLIDILDLASIANRYQSNDLTADINADGRVDILDLVLVAGNYGQQGPVTAWRQ